MTHRPPLSSSPPQSSSCSRYQSTTLSDPITRETFTEIRKEGGGSRRQTVSLVDHGRVDLPSHARDPFCGFFCVPKRPVIKTLSYILSIVLRGRGAPYLATVVIAKPQYAPIGLSRTPIRSANVSEDHADPDGTRSRTKLAIVER
ncbi:hypothetical protein G5I_04920 [Acromyrmex echinatior]|uniref:Uncharacterized protein n=1 Tax=Acromyrmex echinatior TaxID=103372 RepID=F4WGW9_ACREC|nr:hypothetical protein G5I_04920 [Acromyrmex echinatior]